MTYGPVPATLSTECWPKNTLLQSGSQITLCHTHVSETPAFPLARYLWYFSSPVLLGPPPASLPSWPVLPGTMARAPLPSHLWGHHSREVSECLSALLLLSVHFKAGPTGPSLLESTCQVQRSGLLCDEAILAQKTFWGGRIQQSYRDTGLAIKSVQVFIPSYRKPERSIWSTRYKHTCVFTFFLTLLYFILGAFPGDSAVKESTRQFRRHKRRGFDPWVRKILWRREWQLTPVFLPGESHGQRSLMGYSPWGHKRVGYNLETTTISFLITKRY